MFLIFPTGHEQTTARRLPWITIGLVVINLLVFIGLRPAEERADREFQRQLDESVTYLKHHPYLKPPPLLAELLSKRDLAALEQLRSELKEPPPATEQATLDDYVAAAETALSRAPSRRYGYIPAQPSVRDLFTYQFLHGGWAHLIGNLWFLWLIGYVIEDAWGRIAFPIFYLFAGVMAALAHHLSGPHAMGALVGASGSIAGAMGAFLMRNAKTRIKFFAWILIRPVRFMAPAYLMLPLWFASNVLSGFLEPDGVAYWAHVGGFVFGVIVALVLKLGGWDARLDRAVEARGAVLEAPDIAEAARLIEQGKPEVAAGRLEALLQANPKRIDAWLELLRVSAILRDAARESRARLRLMELYLQSDLGQGALDLYAELPVDARPRSVPPSLRLRVARQYERSGRADLARQLLYELHTRPSGGSSDGYDWNVANAALIAHAELATKLGDREGALKLWTEAQAEGHPDSVHLAKQGLARASLIPPR